MPQLESCSRGGGQNLFQRGPKIAAFFYNTSMLGSFVLEIRKLLATSETEFSLSIGAGIGLNPMPADLVIHS